MRRILFDVNVVLDVLLDRKPHAEASSAAWAAVESGRCEGFIAAHAVTTIHYLLAKELGATGAKRAIGAILRVFRVAAVDEAVIQEAMRLSLTDFEDGVTAAAAQESDCAYLLTRDPKGFRGSAVRHIAPEALTALLGQVD